MGLAIAGAFIKGWVVPGYVYEREKARGDSYEIVLREETTPLVKEQAETMEGVVELLQSFKLSRDEELLKSKIEAEVERRLREEKEHNLRAHPTRGGV